MTDLKLNQAREWAESVSVRTAPDGAHAAADLIQSLPDQWVDVEKVREIADDMSNWSIPGMLDTTDSVRLSQMMDGFIDRLNALLAPKLPTLAEMTQEEREACQWMQAELRINATSSPMNCVIAVPGRGGDHARVWHEDGGSMDVPANEVTPLPSEPKLEWPGGVADEEIVERQEEPKPYLFGVTSSESDLPDISVSERIERTESSIKPEGVPPNEPWLIEVDGEKYVGTRYEYDGVMPWSVSALNGSFASDYADHEVTLIHKLVPETHALPEGMRLADHAEHGRVVTSPRVDDDDDYKLFLLTEKARTGSGFAFAHESTLTFLDGEA